MIKYLLLLIGFFLSFLSPANAANDGELWEVGSQVSQDGGSLSPMTVGKICFPLNKNFKEPPQKDDPNCKTEVKTSGKKTTFKTVCKETSGVVTSTGTSEEVGSYHYKTDIMIVEEMRGEPRAQHRQVGYVKKIGTACDSKAMLKGFSGFIPGGAGSSSTSGQSSDSKISKDASEKKSDDSVTKDAIEAGKSLLRGILK